mmetsp:Transcript_9167/g.37601  ORF Transcript_9167/g.37601 Transcript_9167/m.37601 type:complete len:86 (-) Transcript_9167:630-887(-)
MQRLHLQSMHASMDSWIHRGHMIKKWLDTTSFYDTDDLCIDYDVENGELGTYGNGTCIFHINLCIWLTRSLRKHVREQRLDCVDA